MDDKLGQEFPLARGGDDDQRTTYLDHAGAGLYSKSQVSSELWLLQLPVLKGQKHTFLSLQIEAISSDLLSSVHLSPHTSSQVNERKLRNLAKIRTILY